MNDESIKRVKLYCLRSDGQWDEKGTGYVKVEANQNESRILVEREEKNEALGDVLLSVPVTLDDVYQIQQETLIVWNEPSLRQELSLSFEYAKGCRLVWSQIRRVQGHSSELSLSSEESEDDSINARKQELPRVDLPVVEPASLGAILQVLESVRPASKEGFVAQIQNEGYIDKLLAVFDDLENATDLEKLRQLFQIFRLLVMFNDLGLLQHLFSESRALTLVGILEYDPGVSARVDHRRFLTNVASFKEVVPLPGDVSSLVRQVYTVQYIRDTALARILDDFTFLTVNGIIASMHDQILRGLCSSEEFMKMLGSSLEGSQPLDTRAGAVRLCQEMVVMAKSLAPQPREQFFTTLGKGPAPVVPRLAEAMRCSEGRLLQNACDVLWQCAQLEPAFLREVLLSA
eukprot:RCo035692